MTSAAPSQSVGSSQHKASSWRPGPGLLVTAAFIGPGTVTTASLAGARFGFDLLWALLFAVAATIVLQEMSARVGLVARLGLAEAIRSSVRLAWARKIAVALVLLAIVLGNTAYQTGNLMGAGLGISWLTGVPASFAALGLGAAIVVVLLREPSTTSNFLTRCLIGVVLLMSAAFLATAAIARPAPAAMAQGVFGFVMPEGSLLTVLALIGTTVVPYNLFLHATAVQHRWSNQESTERSLRSSRIDTIVAIALGGLVTMAIVSSAAASFSPNAQTPDDLSGMANQLEPLFGTTGSILFSLGLAAAGVTSAITAPLAAGYVVAGAFPKASPAAAKTTSIAVVVIGSLLAFAFGQSPYAVIVIAQAANAILLPLVAVFLLLVMNRRDLLGKHANGLWLNLAGGFVVLVAIALSAKSFWSLAM